ncbi:hypothetical protein SISSUDRAFT_89920 [Sistotremastrum suecicum HHB10207 ss-3]|uniref:Uncharacterized protein n=1 Tax=Sistotremastrum suecicum HHB10207 ss-3 TaxID=1314776 RepID=A0A166BAE1_9AGAM|nr:hypothetical protein SISSUDRAFT_89920 [Sistotremastrum suecicum HHB10207 ss-3]
MADFYTVESGKLVGSIELPPHILIGWGTIDDSRLKLGVITSKLDDPDGQYSFRLQVYSVEFQPGATGHFTLRVSSDAAFDLPKMSITSSVPSAIYFKGPLVLVESIDLLLVANVGLRTGVVIMSTYADDDLTEFISVDFHPMLLNQLIVTQEIILGRSGAAHQVAILDLPSILLDENPVSTAASLASPSHDTLISWVLSTAVPKKVYELSAPPDRTRFRYSHRHEGWVYDILLANAQYLCLIVRKWEIISPHAELVHVDVKRLPAMVIHQRSVGHRLMHYTKQAERTVVSFRLGSDSLDLWHEPSGSARVNEQRTICERWETEIRFPQEVQGDPEDNWWRIMTFDDVYGVAIAINNYSAVDVAVFQF